MTLPRFSGRLGRQPLLRSDSVVSIETDLSELSISTGRTHGIVKQQPVKPPTPKAHLWENLAKSREGALERMMRAHGDMDQYSGNATGGVFRRNQLSTILTSDEQQLLTSTFYSRGLASQQKSTSMTNLYQVLHDERRPRGQREITSAAPKRQPRHFPVRPATHHTASRDHTRQSRPTGIPASAPSQLFVDPLDLYFYSSTETGPPPMDDAARAMMDRTLRSIEEGTLRKQSASQRHQRHHLFPQRLLLCPDLAVIMRDEIIQRARVPDHKIPEVPDLADRQSDHRNLMVFDWLNQLK